MRLNFHSVFAKLLASFVAVIMLLVLFNLFSFAIIRHNIQDQSFRTSQENLRNEVHEFEQYFQLIYNTLLNLYLTPNLEQLDKPKLDYVSAKHLMTQLSDLVSNNSLYLYNLFLYSDKHSLVLESNRGASPSFIFDTIYRYPQ